MATTTTKAPTIPDLTSDPGYARALKRHHEIGGTLADLRSTQRLLQAEFSKLNAASADGPARSDRDRAIDAFLAEGDADTDALDVRRTIGRELADLGEKIEFIAAAVRRHYQTDVAPAKGAAQRKLAPVVFEQVYKPAMRKAVEAMVQFHLAWVNVLTLAEQIAAAELWVSPVDRNPIHTERATANEHLDSAARIVGEAVAQGYFTAAEAKALLPGVKP